MDAHQRLIGRVAEEQDDILGTIHLVADDPVLEDRLFDQLVDLLIEAMFLELRRDYLAGVIGRATYIVTLSELAGRCREAGLLPLPTRHR